jgi:cellulose synthase/poly-beta-1,6-N-acetylglucosamine synthase-like glycosyltransferase
MSFEVAAEFVLVKVEFIVLIYFFLINTFYAILLVSAAIEMGRHLLRVWRESGWRILGSEVAPSLSMLTPAHNEAATVVQSVHALLTLQYPNLEVVLVNDGSTDGTLEVVMHEFELVPIHPIYRRQIETRPVRGLYRSRINPNLVVVDKENGGKADALNAGLNVAQGELVCAMDADTLIEPDALLRMARPFLMADDVVAAGGTIRVANGSQVRSGRIVAARAPRNWLAGVQTVEYLRAFLFGRLGWNNLGGNLIISGAFGLFRRDAMIAADGYLHDTVGEDMELVAHLRRTGIESGTASRVEFIPDPVAWTEVPESLSTLGRQRDRWHRGLADVLWRHRTLLFRPRYGLLGMVVYPYFLVFELFAPVVEAVGLLGALLGLAFGLLDTDFAILFFLVAYGYGLVLSLFTLALEEWSFHRYGDFKDRMLLLGWALVESFGYRQLTLVWRLRGLIKFVRGRTEWGAMARKGFKPPTHQKRAA